MRSDHTVTMKDNTTIAENAGAGIYAYSANGHLALNLEGVTIKENGTSDACSVIVEFESSTSIPEVVLSGSAT